MSRAYRMGLDHASVPVILSLIDQLHESPCSDTDLRGGRAARGSAAGDHAKDGGGPTGQIGVVAGKAALHVRRKAMRSRWGIWLRGQSRPSSALPELLINRCHGFVIV